MLTLYSYWPSSASYRVRIALEPKGVAFESCPVHLVREGGEQLGNDFVAIYPQELVPVLRDESLFLKLTRAARLCSEPMACVILTSHH